MNELVWTHLGNKNQNFSKLAYSEALQVFFKVEMLHASEGAKNKYLNISQFRRQ